MENQTQK